MTTMPRANDDPPPSDRSRRLKSRRRLWVLVAIVGAAALLVSSGWLLSRWSAGPVADRAPLPSPGVLQWQHLAGGTFRMGANDGFPNEKPVHEVTVRDFELTRSEVTVAQYESCMAAGLCEAPHGDDGSCIVWNGAQRTPGVLRSAFRNPDHPVNCVDWQQATAFCRGAGGRLPTEAEWEYAARSAGRTQKFPWGDQTADCSRAVLDNESHPGCGKNSTWPVCSKPIGHTVQGLCDMAGNVWEWVQDDDHDSYQGAPADATAWVQSSQGADRVIRGGGFADTAAEVRTTERGHGGARLPYDDVGFRCAR